MKSQLCSAFHRTPAVKNKNINQSYGIIQVMFDPEIKLVDLGITLPPAPGPAAKYVDCVIVNNILTMSGKGPCAENGIISCGKIGSDFTKDEGYLFAKRVGINMLATLKEQLGSLNKIERVIQIQGIINADPNFTEHHLVLNGLSDLLIEVFGDNGKHARSVLGANSLRDNLPIIATGSFLIRPE